MLQIFVRTAELCEGTRSTYRVVLLLSDGVHEEEKTFTFTARFFPDIPPAGSIISEETYDRLVLAEETYRAARRAVQILSCADRTRKQLNERLARSGFSPAARQGAIAFCMEKGYIDEERQLARLMELLCNDRHYGMRRIAQEAYYKGFPREMVDRTAEEMAGELDFTSAIDARIRGKLPDSGDRAAMNRLTASLLRSGFTYEEVRRAVEREKERCQQ